MAISYSNYVKVTSSFVDAGADTADLCGLVIVPFTTTCKSDFSGKADFEAGKMITLGAGTYGDCFAASSSTTATPISDVYKFCQRYFSYVSPNGNVARTIRVMRKKLADESSDAAFKRAINEGGSFGSFFIMGDANASNLKTVAESNVDINNEYRMVAYVQHTAAEGDYYYENYGTKKTEGETTIFTPWDYAGFTFTECPYLSMAILAATDYNGTNTATTHEFKSLTGESPTVTDDETKGKLDGFRISYYGQTKANGAKMSFYQEGFNADGTDTACYDNEMWMKRTIISELLSLEVSVERIPPTPTGVAMVVNAITGVVNMGLKNGSILPEKPITQSQRAHVIQMAGGDPDAVFKLNQYGYILAADIDTYTVEGKQKYKIVYKLVYLKGDSVRFIEGTHNII